MATVEKFVQPVYETRTVHVGDETSFLLSLSQEEAEVLQVILTRVGGEPSGPRGKANAVFEALRDVLGSPYGPNGIWDGGGIVDKYPFESNSGLYFAKEES